MSNISAEQAERIKTASLKSIKWVSFGVVLPKLLAPITSVYLANVLVPSDYGTLSVSNVFVGFLTLVQGLGFSDYIIKEKECSDEVLYTAFWGNIGVSILFYALLLVATPLIASLYSAPILHQVLPIFGVSVIVNAIGMVPQALLVKNLKMKRLFFIQLAPTVVTVAVIVPLASLGFGVWAFVAGSMTQVLLTNMYYLVSSEWFPRMVFSYVRLLEMARFGKFVLAEKTQEFFYANLDTLFLGYFTDIRTLGIYSLAKGWTLIVFNMLNGPIPNIVYPAMANFKGDFPRLRDIYLKVEKRVFALNLPLVAGITAISSFALPLFLPDRWNGLAFVLSALVIGEGIARNLSLQRDLFKILDRPDVYPKSFFINFLYALIIYPLGAKFGIVVFCVVRVLNDLAYTAIQMLATSKVLQLRLAQFWHLSRPAVVSSLIMGSCVIAFASAFSTLGIVAGRFLLLPLIGLGVVVYATAFWLLDRDTFRSMVQEGKIVIGFS